MSKPDQPKGTKLMILKRFYDEKLAHASYLVGCPGAGEACIIDPNRDLNQYITVAQSEGLRITKVAETHIHADYLSGSQELAEITGAELLVSDEGDADWKYDSTIKATLLKEGDSFRIGALRFDIWHTPGHTPEHITHILTDEATSPEPFAAFTGDLVFVGDVGRPDLLEEAAGITGTAEPGARRLFHTLERFKTLPDHIMIWPAHGAGSACGKSLGGSPVSSLGYEKLTNWGLRHSVESEFVKDVLAGQPEPPAYFAQMKARNKQKFASITNRSQATLLTDPTIAEGKVILDVRPSINYLGEHIYGSLHAPVQAQGFTTWAGWFVPYDQPIVLISQSQADAEQAIKDLRQIGLDQVVGYYLPSSIPHFSGNGSEVTSTISIPAESCNIDQGHLLDIRGLGEYVLHNHPASTHIPMGYLRKNQDKLKKESQTFVHCQGGTRSPVAISVLEHLGHRNLVNVQDGILGFNLTVNEPTCAR
ncbi:MBL fold metallo-hydrolase [bacterium]|nr:MBL fold metallo-hydrolase [bacterium]